MRVRMHVAPRAARLASPLGAPDLYIPIAMIPYVWESVLLHGGRLGGEESSSCTRREGVGASAWGEDARSMRSMPETDIERCRR